MKISEAKRRADSNAKMYGGEWTVSVFNERLVISEAGEREGHNVIYSTLRSDYHEED